VDLPSINTELRFRGLDQEKVDSALSCLVHVYAVQDFASPDVGGVLAEDIINVYPLEVVQAASQLFLEKSMSQGREVFRVKWGCEEAAKTMKAHLWEHGSERWEEFVNQVDGRYLGFFMPVSDDGARVITNWRISRELKWFSVQVPRQGWKILSMIDDISEVAQKLDLAFGYRPFGTDGVSGPYYVLHERAYEILKTKKIVPPDELLKSIRLWRFFSEYDVHATDFVALMKDCGLTLDEVNAQVKEFFDLDLTSQYREGQYPPYFVNSKKKKEFQQAVSGLLRPMDSWLSRSDLKALPSAESSLRTTP
jgi:hypothetical protein